MRNDSDKIVQKIKTHFMYNIFLYEYGTVYEIMWKKYGIAGLATDYTTVRRMRFACWITKATITRSEYAILIALPWQQ
jgi:hypothetical protein